MILTFNQDFGSSTILDSELMGVSDSGLYWNRGTHALVNIQNLLSLLPKVTFTFEDYAAGTTYNKFMTSRQQSDIVMDGTDLYQSLKDSNVGNDLTDTDYWLPTNIESIRIKSFIWNTEDNYKSALSLNIKLIENQYIYNVADELLTLSNDFNGWVFEPKGSDYVRIVINQMSIQANTTTPVNVYVINQGILKDTLILNPSNGLLEFEEINYTISGKGKFYFVFESQEVYSNSEYNDALKYKGFVCYPVTGTGSTAADADYADASTGNGLNFNISAYLESSIYIDNNEVYLAKFIQSQFEMDVLNLDYYNPNTQSNRDQRNVSKTDMLATEILDKQGNTAANRYHKQLKIAKESINNTFDKFLKVKNRSFVTKSSTI